MMTTIGRRLLESVAGWATLAAVLTVLGGCTSVSGQDHPRVPPDLLQRARRGGEVTVIVQLRVDAGAAEPAIEATKAALLAEIAQTDHRVVRALRGLPVVALDASYATLVILNSSARVLRVEEDRLARPQG
jgi:hypothetical protein